MQKFTVILFLLLAGVIQSQDKGILEGMVLDGQQANDPLAFVNISLKKTSMKTSTNIDGAYALEVSPGTYTVVFNFPGYEKLEISSIVVKAGEITSLKKIALAARAHVITEASLSPKKEK